MGAAPGVEVFDPSCLLGPSVVAGDLDGRPSHLRLVVVPNWSGLQSQSVPFCDMGSEWAMLVVAGLERAWLSPILGGAGIDPRHLLQAVHRHDDIAAALVNAGVAPLEQRSMWSASAELLAAINRALAHLQNHRSSSMAVIEIGPDRPIIAHPVPDLHPPRLPPKSAPAQRPNRRSRHAFADGQQLLDAVHDRIGSVIDPVTGILAPARLLPVAQNSSTVPVAIAHYAAPDPCAGLLYELRRSPPARLARRPIPTRTGFGADWTPAGALAKATLEAYERFLIAGTAQFDTVRSTFDALTESAYWIERDVTTSGREHMRWRSTVDGSSGSSTTTMSTDWVRAGGLDGSKAYLPAALIYRGAASDDKRFGYQQSGSAIGFNRDDTILRGLLEVIERDAVSRWWCGITRPRAVAPQAITDHVHEFIGGQEYLARRVELRDVTCWNGVPVVVAWLIEGNQAPLIGLGSGVTLAAAVQSAVFELAQTTCFADQQRNAWPLDPEATAGLLSVDDVSEPSNQGLALDRSAPLDAAFAISQRLGQPVLIHDLSSSIDGVYGVKVVVPTLCGLDGPFLDDSAHRPRFPA